MIARLYMLTRTVMAMPVVQGAIAFGAASYGIARLGQLVDEHRQTLQQLTATITDKRAELRHVQSNLVAARVAASQTNHTHTPPVMVDWSTYPATGKAEYPATGKAEYPTVDNGAASEPAAAGVDEHDQP